MGLFNNLQVEAACRRCGTLVPRCLQFKYGYCRLYDYRVGDEVGWASGRGRLSNYGERAAGRA